MLRLKKGWMKIKPTLKRRRRNFWKKNNLLEISSKLTISVISKKAGVNNLYLGAMVVFLCSEAGANIRGSDFSMDGGWTAQ